MFCACLHEVWSGGCHAISRQLISGNLIHIASKTTEDGRLVDDWPLQIVAFHRDYWRVSTCWVKQRNWYFAQPRRWLMRCRRSVFGVGFWEASTSTVLSHPGFSKSVGNLLPLKMGIWSFCDQTTKSLYLGLSGSPSAWPCAGLRKYPFVRLV